MSNLQTVEEIPAAGSPVHTITMWLVILVSLGIVFADNFHQPKSAAISSAVGNAAMPNIGLELASRYVVGINSLKPLPADQAGQLLSRLDALAKTPGDHLRVAIVAGQVQGALAALKRLPPRSALANDPSLADDYWDLLCIYNAEVGRPLREPDFPRLIQRYGWFGQVAAGFDSPPNSEARQAFLRPAVRTLIVFGLGFAALIAALVAGVVLCGIALVRLATRKLPLAYVPPAGANVLFLEAFALFMLLQAIAHVVYGKWSGPPGTAGIVLYFSVTILIAVLPIFWPIFRGMRWTDFRQALGWNAGRGIIPEIGAGIVGYIGGLPIVALGVLAVAWLMRVTGVAPSPHPIVRAIGKSPAITAELFLLASLYAPIVEETLFRGALFGYLRGRFGWIISAFVVSLIFAALHPQGWVAIPLLFSVAVVLAAVREWRASLLPCMVIHCAFNTITLVLLTVCLS